MVLPPGSEVFQLEAAESGHLLLPCDNFDKQQLQHGEHHLFADGVGNNSSSSSSSSAIIPCVPMPSLLTTMSTTGLHEHELLCAAALANFSLESSSALLLRLAKEWHKETTPQGSFPSSDGFSKCIGMFTHGGVIGLSTIAKQRPHLSQLLCRIVREATATSFTTIMMNFNMPAPIHQDAYNQGHNAVVPVIMPRKGGHLWIELQQGDKIEGEIDVCPVKSGHVAGQIMELRPGQAVHFSPKRLHATQAWSGGDRWILAAYTSGSYWKASSEVTTALLNLGYELPVHEAAHEVITSQVEPAAEGITAIAEDRPKQVAAPPPPPISSPKPLSAPAGRPQQKSRASAFGIIKRVLLVTVFQSTYFAFQDNGFEPTRLRPTELLRSGFDTLPAQLKGAEYSAVWVDLSDNVLSDLRCFLG